MVAASARRLLASLESEWVEESLTLATLGRVAAALDCRVKYVLVPRRPLDDMVWEHARAKAPTAEIAAVDHTMELVDFMWS